MKLIAVRHAEVEATGICYGRLDVPTLDLIDERKALLQELQFHIGENPCVIWSSPSERCLRDAVALGTLVKVIPQIDTRLYELAFGQWEGKLWSELETQSEFKEWMMNWQIVAPPDGECLGDLTRRVSDWLAQLQRVAQSLSFVHPPHLEPAPSCLTHVVFTHAGVIRQLHVSLNQLNWEEAMRIPVPSRTPLIWDRPV